MIFSFTSFLPLDGVYPVSITYFSVSVWVDAGEVDQFIPLGSFAGRF